MPIALSLPRERFNEYVARAIDGMFPDGMQHDIAAAVSQALARCGECFSRVRLPGYHRDGMPYLNHLHGDQSAVFWYFLSNSAFTNGDKPLAEKCMLVNKARNGLLVSYDTTLPPHMLLVHTVGTMLGKATYGDFFVATQNVTVGTHKGNAPTFGQGVILYPRSFVAGASRLGDFARVAVGSTIIDLACDAHHTVSGVYPAMTARPSKRETIGEYFSGFS